MATASRYVCELPVAEVPARRAQVQQLRSGVIDWERDDDRVRLRFAPDLSTAVRAFVRDESSCCGFFDFEVAAGEGEVTLDVSAPAEAALMLDGLVAALTGDDPPAADPSA